MSFFTAPLRPFLSACRYAPVPVITATRAFSLFDQTPRSTSGARVIRALPRPAFAGAARECPTPVILVRAVGLREVYGGGADSATAAAGEVRGRDREADEDWSSWAGMFAERGYTTLEVDVEAPGASRDGGGEDAAMKQRSREQATEVLKEMSKLLASQIRLLAIPFAPIVISEGHSSWLAQAYVEDNPASGLVMINPAPTAADSHDGDPMTAAAASPIFSYEPHFPVLVLASPTRMEATKQSRVGKYSEKGVGRGGKGVTLEVAPEDSRGEARRLVCLCFLCHWDG